VNVNLHLERLVLDGVDVSAGDGEAIGRAVALELERLLAAGSSPEVRDFSAPAVRAASLALPPGAGSGPIGAGIARSVYEQLGSSAPPKNGGDPR
jgi:hypothetical protein